MHWIVTPRENVRKSHKLQTADKVKLLQASEIPGVKQQDLVSPFTMSKSQISVWLKSQAEIHEEFDRIVESDAWEGH